MNNTLEVLTPLRAMPDDVLYLPLKRLIAPDGRLVAYVPDQFVDVIVEALENYDDRRKYTAEEMDTKVQEALDEGYEEGKRDAEYEASLK